ncbi:MAG TPA: ribosome maturation factor RimM [Chromatiaceae bacterium]|jgi:16S rRNA processing protein RimM|nr:ribosome maturation factor RimM [Chromatiaceae bacterium]HIN82033.1 ribosome maturation factor RimM [Chromatiales bacterium]HIA08469.1 ribosome maturation factor RimM [Chromatiaceae bacterium]HIB84205.1 ribosome maturation factor RimM [Chromatiaceae bacterium]HIO13924.1 ribosome maturation factor RimM [Chromatiales bacterium]
MANDIPDDLVVIGRVSGVYGVKGWVRIFSDTQPREGILGYRPWYLKTRDGWQQYELLDGQKHGKGVVAHVDGFHDRDEVRVLINCDIGVSRSQFEPPQEGEYFWSDLEGLKVVTTQGVDLGKVDSLMETGANDVLVVHGDRERLIPFVLDHFVISVDLEAGVLTVDWDPED